MLRCHHKKYTSHYQNTSMWAKFSGMPVVPSGRMSSTDVCFEQPRCGFRTIRIGSTVPQAPSLTLHTHHQSETLTSPLLSQ